MNIEVETAIWFLSLTQFSLYTEIMVFSTSSARHEVGRIDDDGREGRRDDQPHDNGQYDRPRQAGIGKQQGEGRRSEDRDPDHVLPDVEARKTR